MQNLTLADIESIMATAHTDHTGMTNDDLICAVMGNDNATATELELAQRLESALTEISTLTAGQVQH